MMRLTFLRKIIFWLLAVLFCTPGTVVLPENDLPHVYPTDALTAIAFYSASNPRTRKSYTLSPAFSADETAYTVTVPDAAAVLYAQATPGSGWTVTAQYTQTDGTPYEKAIDMPVDSLGGATFLNACLQKGGKSQRIVFHISHTADGTEESRDYSVLVRRSLHLSSLSLDADGTALPLRDAAGTITAFSRDVTDYTLEAEQGMQTLTLHAAFTDSEGYFANINGQRTDDVSDVTVPLTAQAQQTVTVEVCHADADAVPVTYQILVQKTEPVRVQFRTTPIDATVFLTRDDTGTHVPVGADGCRLMGGAGYTCIVTANGFVGQKLSLTAPQTDDVIDVVLTKAPSSVLPDADALPQSGRTADNNGVTNAKIPCAAEDTMLYWAKKLGEGADENACGCPILANGFLYTYAGTHVYKIDPASGKVLAQGEMDAHSGFAIQTPTFAEGMLFVGLNGGAVQAFRADTLESLWIYHNARGGQPNCPIRYRGGCIYTGFWVDEQTDADFVCLRVTDEDPQTPLEEKLPCWTYTNTGGFYWAGAYAGDDFVLVGTEDGESGWLSGYASILSFSPETGELIDAVRLPYPGDVRSSVTYANGTAYCTTRSGWFYAIDVSPQGTFGTLHALRLENGTPDSVPASTSTPTIYGCRAYVGVCGSSQFTAYSGHNLTVIDLSDFSVAYSVPTKGFAQTDGLLTTAYEADGGYVYVYFFDNYTPGKLRVLRDRPGQTAPDYTTAENGMETAYTLFTPYGAHAQYALCSPVADGNGTLYFKNDSGYLFALGSRPVSIDVTSLPDRRSYTEGETFDPAGMTVYASFADGSVRDVTDLVRFSQDPLTEDDASFWIEYPYAVYHDADGEAGVSETAPFAVLELDILPHSTLSGDADGDGKLTAADVQRMYAYLSGVWTPSPAALQRCDFDGDGAITVADAQKLRAFLTHTA